MVFTECGFRLAPKVVQAPDVAFIREDRLAGIELDRYCEFDPDPAVEILSPGDNAARLQRYEKHGPFRTLTADDRIDAPELLAGFSIAVRTLFE
jgi:Uma2 family endonuclease